MIKVNNLNKFFNKNKTNEIHVINNTNITFPDSGLVCLLGPSGCGKTTLLNAIGGLDRVDSGEIIVGDNKFKKYSSNKWDYIRNLHYGYIFQNYILLPDITVYQNLEFVLKMLDLSQDEIDERIDYALNAVGMMKFKKRKAKQLSGGQQQRIVIARALVKSPNIVIADEPTGNLDEKNSTQIMNIIKKISKECLVVLVTHERRLADFYADYIIEVKDGQVVKQFKVTEKKDLQHIDDSNIYLKEYQKEEIDSPDVNIQYFFKDKKQNVKLRIIIEDNTVYLQSNQDNLKIKFIDSSNEVKIFDTHKPVIKQENIDEFEYKLPKIIKDAKTKVAGLRTKDIFKMSLNNLSNLKRKQKILFVVFFLTAIMVVLSLTNYLSATFVNEKDFLYDNRNIVEVDSFHIYNDDYEKTKEILGVDTILAQYNYLELKRFNFDIFIQGRGGVVFPKNTLLPITLLEEPNLYMGRLPRESGEIVVDKWLVDIMLNDTKYRSYGISSYQQFIGSIVDDNNLDLKSKIVGIVDTNNPNIYCTLNDYYTAFINFRFSKIGFSENFTHYDVADITHYYEYEAIRQNPYTKNKVEIENLNLEKDEILVSRTYFNSVNKASFGEIEFEIVGVYDADGEEDIILSTEALEEIMIKSIATMGIAAVYSTDKEATINQILEYNYLGIDSYESELQKNEILNMNYGIYLIAFIVLVASFVFLFFIMRSSLISRVYEVGVYRALGIKKSYIYKMFIIEISLITLITAGIGVILISTIVYEVNSIISIVYFPWFISLISIIFLMISNLVVGMIPVISLLRLTPAQILSKYDI